MDERRHAILLMLKYFNSINGNRTDEKNIRVLADLFMEEMKHFDESIFSKVLEFLYDNHSRFPSIADVKMAYEEVMKKENLNRKSDCPNRIMPKKLLLIQEQLLNWIIESYFNPDNPEIRKNIELLKTERKKIIERLERKKIWTTA